KKRLYEKAEDKANKALEKAREEAEIIVQEVRQMKDKTLWKEHEWIEARKMLEEAKPGLIDEEPSAKVQEQLREFEVGDEIKHQTLGQNGEIIEKKNNHEFVIQVGRMKMTAKDKDLIFVKKGSKQPVQEAVSHVLTSSSSNSHVKPELDLRGERYEDAMLQLEKYIDEALLQGYPQVTIIHGKGTGALRKGVEKFIKHSSAIKTFRQGGQGEGGSGVTVAELE